MAKGKRKKQTVLPSYREMVETALCALNQRECSSRQAFLKYVRENYAVSDKSANRHVKLALRSGIRNCHFRQTKGFGANGSFKLVMSNHKKKMPYRKRDETMHRNKTAKLKQSSTKADKTPRNKTAKLKQSSTKANKTPRNKTTKLKQSSTKANKTKLKKNRGKIKLSSQAMLKGHLCLWREDFPKKYNTKYYKIYFYLIFRVCK